MEGEIHIPTSSTAPVKSELNIDCLDDDSLGIIFNQLSLADRLRIESVCRRWRSISKANLCWYSKRLIIDYNMGGFSCQQANSNEESTTLLEESLRRLSPYLEEIIFKPCSAMNFEEGTIERIAGLCPKLKSLHLGFVSLNHEDWLAISNNLEALSFGIFADGNGNELKELLRRNKQLRRLQVHAHPWCKPSTFDYLDPGQLECLQLTRCRLFALTNTLADKLAESLVEFKYYPYTNDTYYPQHLCKLKNLRSLNLQIGFVPFQATLIANIAQNCRKLERLTLAFPKDYPSIETIIPPLFGLPYLRSLVISVRKDEVPRDEGFDILFQRATNLKLFVMSTCAQCRYEENGNFKCCYAHVLYYKYTYYSEVPKIRHFVMWRRK